MKSKKHFIELTLYLKTNVLPRFKKPAGDLINRMLDEEIRLFINTRLEKIGISSRGLGIALKLPPVKVREILNGDISERSILEKLCEVVSMLSKKDAQYFPEGAVRPSSILRIYMNENYHCESNLSNLLDVPEETVQNIMSDHIKINRTIAATLYRIYSIPKDTWSDMFLRYKLSR